MHYFILFYFATNALVMKKLYALTILFCLNASTLAAAYKFTLSLEILHIQPLFALKAITQMHKQ